MADGKVSILVDVDGKQVKVLNEELDRVTNKGQQGTNALKGFAVGAAVFKVAQAGLDLLVQSLDKAISRFDTLQSFPRVMKAMGHSTEDVTRSTNKLAEGIDGLPTTLDEVVGTAQRLTSITGDLNKSTDLTLALNNAFLASGSSSADASRGLQQYAQMLSAGKVDMQSWKTLQETMPYALQKTAESFGYAGASAQKDFYDALKSGRITFDQFGSKLVELNDGVGGFAELAKTNSEGIATSFGNLRNAIAKGLANIIDAFNEVSKQTTGKSIAQNIDKLKAIINAGFAVVNSTIKSSVPVFKLFVSALSLTYSSAKALSPVLAGLAASYATLMVIKKVQAVVETYNKTMVTARMIIAAHTMAKNLATAAENVNTAAISANMVAQLRKQGLLKVSTVLYGVATGAISLATAGEIAMTLATNALSAALAILTGPIGWVVAGVGLLVAAGVALWKWLNTDSEETKKLKKNQEDLVKQTDNLTDSIKTNTKERANAVKEIKGTTEGYQQLGDEIITLARKENKSAGDKENLKKKIDTLNDSVAGLNLAYDENSNSLSHNAQQLQTRISAIEAETKWSTAQQNMLQIEKERVQIENQLNAVAKQRQEVMTSGELSGSDYKKMVHDLNEKEKELKTSLENNRTEYASTSAAQAAASEAMAAAAEAGANRQVVSYASMSDAQKVAVDSMRSKFNELVETTTSMFGAIEQKTALSVEQVTANLEANRAATEQWANNIQILAQRGVDQGILEQLRQMGPEGALQTQAFVDATDEQLAGLETAFTANMETAKTAMKTQLDSTGVEVPESAKNIITNISTGMQAELANANFASLGGEIPNGVVSGITNGTEAVGTAAKGMATKVKDLFKEDLDIHSPSRVFQEYGGFVTEGLKIGLSQGTANVVSAINTLASQMRESGTKLAKDMESKTKSIANAFSNLGPAMYSHGVNAMYGFANGISAAAPSAISAASTVAAQVKRTMQRALDIHSPSRVMRDEVGRYIPQGIAVGIEADSEVIARSMEKLKASMLITAPETALGIDKALSAQINLKQAISQTIVERVDSARDKATEMIDRALEIAEEAVKRPVNMILDDGTLVARTGDKFRAYQDRQDSINNRMRGVIA